MFLAFLCYFVVCFYDVFVIYVCLCVCLVGQIVRIVGLVKLRRKGTNQDIRPGIITSLDHI